MVWAYDKKTNLWYKGKVFRKFQGKYIVYCPTRRFSIVTDVIQKALEGK